MLRTTATIVLVPLMLGMLTAELRGDDVPASKPSELTDELTVTEAVQFWSSAVNEIHRVDVEFICYTYDLEFEIVRCGEGRLVVESGFKHFVSIDPSEGHISSPRLKKSGMPFDVRPADSERYLMNPETIWIIDDDQKSAMKLQTGRSRDSDAGISTSFLVRFLESSFNSLLVVFTTFGQINGPFEGPGSSFPQVTQTLEQRFEITMTRKDAEHVYLTLLPRFPKDGNCFRNIDVQLSRATWLPDATKFWDPSGTKETVYLIRTRRINDCPETTEHLFDPDLTGYNIDPPQPARSSTAAAGR